MKKNSVFIATSLDGFIADKNGGLDWLQELPNPEKNDMGYADFMQRIDALLMGRKTFETICGFDGPWPYHKPVFVLSNRLPEIPKGYKGKAFLVNGSLTSVLSQINALGHNNLYIDGGITVQSFLKEDLIDELIITTFPILLGGGTPLFSELPERRNFELAGFASFLNAVTQSQYLRKR
mgnify:FL=1